MTEAELRAFAISICQLAFVGGVLGAVSWSLLVRGACWIADAFCAWEEKRIRIHQARMRYQHGPLLLPGASRWVRSSVASVLRSRAKAQGGLARACEGLDDMRPHRAHF